MSFLLNSSITDLGVAVKGLAQNRLAQGVAAVAAAGFVYKKWSAAQARAKFFASIKKQEKGRVYIYALPRVIAKNPNLSQNVTKIEAFCRVHNIPYSMVMGLTYGPYSPTETMPFIALDGKLTGESTFCIDAIKEHFNIDENLSPVDEANAILIRKTVDWSLTQHLARTNMVDNTGTLDLMATKFASLYGAPLFLAKKAIQGYRKSTIQRLNTSGIGWLDDERYQLEFVRDVEAIAALVEASQAKGNKYLFGNKPTSVDGMLYGLLSITIAGFGPHVTVNAAGVKALTTNAALVKFYADFEAEVYPDLGKIAPCGACTQDFN